MAESILGLIEQGFVKLDTRLLLPLYRQCREIAKEEAGNKTLYCAKIAPLFEQRCKKFDIKLTADYKPGNPGIFTQWYMSIRFSWVFQIAIVRDKKKIYREIFDAPDDITAREFLTHLWNTLSAWNHSESKNAAPVRSTQPARPAQSSKPIRPVQPVRPAQPIKPIQPAIPTQPVKPSQQARPAQPVRPVQPARPAQPVRPAQPAPPARPIQPAPPVQPSKPVQPAPPAKPAQAAKPVQPETPAPPEPPKPPKRIELGDIAQAEAQNDELMDLLQQHFGEDEN